MGVSIRLAESGYEFYLNRLGDPTRSSVIGLIWCCTQVFILVKVISRYYTILV